jgi:hypothetical protein
VKLDASVLAKLYAILERIDAGKAHPRIPGPVGQYLLEYEQSRGALQRLLDVLKLQSWKDGSCDGFSPIHLHFLSMSGPHALGHPLGEVVDALAFSEELGGLINLVLWLKAPKANAAFNIIKEGKSLQLDGVYRWFVPGRVTPGAAFGAAIDRQPWHQSNCIRAVADDLLRPPHALEYVMDAALGPAGLKFFRSVCARAEEGRWIILPGLEKPMTLPLSHMSSQRRLPPAHYQLLVYRTPWEKDWRIADSRPVNQQEILRHTLNWLDYRRQLLGEGLDAPAISALRSALISAKVDLDDRHPAPPQRILLPQARTVVSWLRGNKPAG